MQSLQQVEIQYRPHNAQTPFHLDRYKVFARLCSAGTGGGKTLAGAYEALLWAFENPGSVGYVFEPTYKMVKRILLPTLESPLLLGAPIEANPLVEDFNRTDSRIRFVNSTEMWMLGLEDPESAEGPNVDWIWSDESRLVRHLDVAWQVWTRRLRGSQGSKYPRGLWCTTTPDQPGSELHKRFEDPKTRLENSRVYRWSIDDNPHLPETYIRGVKEAHTGGLAERFVYGRFANVAAGSFMFDSTLHVLDAMASSFREVRYGVDFGWTNPSAIVAVGFDGDGRAYVLDEFYQRQTGNESLGEAAQEMVAEWGGGPFICDRSEPKTIQELSLRGLNARADESKREDGIRALGSRFQKAGDERPRIYISSRCVNLIAELQSYNADRKENDHAVDALRYALGVSSASPVFAFE